MAPAANIEKADLMGILDAVAKQAEKLVKRLKTKACFSVSRLQLDTLELMDKTVARWPRELSSPGRFVTPYFIQLSFRDIDQPDKRKFFNRIPTSFSLTDEQVEKLIAAGRELLRSNRDFQRFVAKNR